MAKQTAGACGHLIILWLLLSFISEAHLRVTTLIDVTIRSEEQCMSVQEEGIRIQAFNHYKLGINFGSKGLECPADKKGFACGVTMSLEDPFDAVGNKLCVDLSGVAGSIPHSQFAIIISDAGGEIQRVYIKSSRLDRPPYNIKCSERGAQYIKILLRVLWPVEMCPNILPTLANHTTNLGTVFVKKDLPTYTLVENECQQNHRQYFEEHSILKVIPGGSYRYGCALSLRPQVQYRQIQTCITLEYISADFNCKVQVLAKKGMVKYLSFSVPKRAEWNRLDRTDHCFNYNWFEEPDNSFPNLVVQSNNIGCQGNFALEIKYSRSVKGESGIGPKSSINRRNLYMAVFISVISVCIFIMGLTCLCCLRMRARSRQRNHHRSGRRATANGGCDGNLANGESPAFWTSTSSDQVFGLPSYEEATLGSVPSSPGEAEKPPAYETLYTGENILPSSSASPPIPQAGESSSPSQPQSETLSAPDG
ncbi:hypothetical protein ElyMa_002912400 [Elysia marginata]|uniref:CUB domain-containing protein n=1 Tax=Elysia marginata TaxID=1093978 RepID=A0AAV4I5X5_9GAST|nr:hypothetical protein ElyMa_002912400 [Elysia marginata]